MAKPTRAASQGTFFVSTQTLNRRRLFQVDANCQLLFDTLQHYRREGHYKLHAFVIMPDHIHLLLTPQEISIERAMMLIKGGFSHKMESKFSIWQRGFTDRRMRGRIDFENHRNYIHDNPVRARFCQKAEDFRWSSCYDPTHPAPEGEI
jgi:putative transposase